MMVVEETPTILFVDKDEECRREFGSALRRAGFDVTEAATGREALRMTAKHPSLVVMDVELPDMDGYELCRRIKTHPATNSIPVLHFSQVFTRSEERTHSLEDGADANLSKPAPSEELLAQVRAMFRSRKSELQVRRAARQWKNALDATADAVCVLDINGRVSRCNRAMAELLRLPFASIVGRPWRSPIRSALDPEAVPDLVGVHEAGARRSGKVHSGGRWFRITADPMWSDSGVPAGSVQVFTEITDIERADGERDRLVAERDRLAAQLALAMDVAEEGVCWVDSRGICTFLNRAGAAMLGYAPSELVGADFRAVAHHTRWNGRPDPDGDWPLSLLGPGVGVVRINHEVLCRRDGTTFPAEYTVREDRTLPGEGAVVTFEDTSGQAQQQRTLAEFQKLGTVGRLAAGLVHDFNNVLTIVEGNAVLLLMQTPEDDPIRSSLEAIEFATRHAAGLTRQLLQLSRPHTPAIREVDLRWILDEQRSVLGTILAPLIALEADYPDDLWTVRANADQLRRILVNLSLNARDAMPDGGRLSFRAANVVLDAPQARALGDAARPGEFVRLSVADTGTGIPADVLPRLFDPFFTTKGGHEGTGLGLAIIGTVVQDHHGWISVSSVVNQGSRFDIHLPRDVGSPVPPA